MVNPKRVLAFIAAVISVAAILLSIFDTVSPQTGIVFLGISLLVLSAAVLQR